MGWAPSAGNGLDRMFSGLARHLPDTGIQVTGWATGQDEEGMSTDGIHMFSQPSAPLPRRLWAVRNAIQSTEALKTTDLVASHFALYTAPLLDLIEDKPLVVHFHGPWAMESAIEGASSLNVRMKHWLEQQVYQRGDRFIVLSNAFRDVLATEYFVDPSRIDVVPGGVDVERFKPVGSRAAARQVFGLCPHRPIVVCVRRLVTRVGLFSLLDAVDQLRHHEPDLLVLVAGRGPLAGPLNTAIEERGLSRHIRLLGFVPDADLPSLYRAADVSIVPSTHWEGFGLVAAESLAAGTPALVTPIGGLPEVVSPLSDALVLEDNTPTAVAQGLREALRGTRPLPVSEDCYRYARDRFAWPVIADQVHTIYTKACS